MTKGSKRRKTTIEERILMVEYYLSHINDSTYAPKEETAEGESPAKKTRRDWEEVNVRRTRYLNTYTDKKSFQRHMMTIRYVRCARYFESAGQLMINRRSMTATRRILSANGALKKQR